MADLPAARVNPADPFSKTGVDYDGPFEVLQTKGRGASSTKGYVAVFVCLITKAIDLELVGDLTTESFLAALTRFTGRRGRPLELWSDNATNFRGADLELRRLFQDAKLDWHKVEDSLAQESIRWQFIPPSAPHFGGLWEAGVKSMNLRRVAGLRNLVYEEFATLLVEIEMVLNSRPLVPLTGDLEDLNTLTPGHFLIGRALNSLPQPPSSDRNLDRLSHWWSRDYLNTLQKRSKWTRSRPNLKVGEMVVVIDPSLLGPSGGWPIGRIMKTHGGPDQLILVATVKTQRGTYTRPVTKLVQLPVTTT
ncbi:uncharacterized protein LOC122499785 [Leptopilina heterotoma]|uniref:uncharacterized protein LOC122499785 n=1 Tax=Leptopilina heterotoma TaxID=63436 RepID=UPI001CA99F60|nr:uncharacterized protein LOC122499785 [Leptopilina heterotoma]